MIVLRKCARCSREFDAIVEDGNPIYCESCRLAGELEEDEAEYNADAEHLFPAFSYYRAKQTEPYEDSLEESIAFEIAKNLKKNIKDAEIGDVRFFGAKNGSKNRVPKSRTVMRSDRDKDPDEDTPGFVVEYGNDIDFSKYDFAGQFGSETKKTEPTVKKDDFDF